MPNKQKAAVPEMSDEDWCRQIGNEICTEIKNLLKVQDAQYIKDFLNSFNSQMQKWVEAVSEKKLGHNGGQEIWGAHNTQANHALWTRSPTIAGAVGIKIFVNCVLKVRDLIDGHSVYLHKKDNILLIKDTIDSLVKTAFSEMT